MAIGLGVDVPRQQPVTLVLSGEFDQAGVTELEETFRWVAARHGRSNVIIDVSALEFCDSAAWHARRALLRAGRDAAGLGAVPAPPLLPRSGTRTCCRPTCMSCAASIERAPVTCSVRRRERPRCDTSAGM